MGCDIHLYVERLIDGQWVQQFNPEETENNYRRKYWYSNRSYALFGILAGVRSGDYYDPIAEPRGVPNDLSDGLKAEWKEQEGDGHTPSYYLLPELLKAKESTFLTIGFINTEQYKLYKQTGKPDKFEVDDWYFRDHKLLSNEDMDRVIGLTAFWGEEKNYTEIIWEQPYKDIGYGFWDNTLTAIQKVDPDPNNVRIVFWFDN